MRGSIATYRESLSRLAGEVEDAAADEAEPQASAASSPPARGAADRSHTTPPSSGRGRRYSASASSAAAARPDPAEPDEVPVSKLQEDIQKLQVSEAEIKALSFNYVAMLKEKEGRITMLIQTKILLDMWVSGFLPFYQYVSPGRLLLALNSQVSHRPLATARAGESTTDEQEL
ncbi:hypothetical protein OsI_29086 [Oryza sativa Indica Group]|uniref:Uncharacterized protein n=1 Tax=Oryza sativa subsp. indica TaxID=39946 RepID=A2YUU0_ORYSI|nr:hypothetical protein OsI_29086 [Oryza sativa Indica Group]